MTPAPDAAPSPQAQLPLDPAAPADPSPTPPVAPPAKPEGLPDRYFDPATGVRLSEVASTLAELEAQNARQAEAFKDFPEKPEDAGKFYALPESLLPEGTQVPEGVKIEANADLLNKALPVLHKHKIGRDAFQELAQAFTAYELERFKADQEFFAAENKKLGDNAVAIRNDTAQRMKARAGDKASLIDVDHFVQHAPAGVIQFMQAVLAESNVVPLTQNRDNAPTPPPQKIEDRWYGGQQQKAG